MIKPYIHPCSAWDHCSASFCPATQQGLFQPGDPVCEKTGRNYAANFNRDNKGITQGEAMTLILRRYDKINLNKKETKE